MGLLDPPGVTLNQVASFSSVRRNLIGVRPQLVKSANNPVFTQGSQGSTFSTIQWPWLVNVVAETGAVGTVYGERYRMYYSTDHENATARIGMLTATNREGPWTDRGAIYQDSTSGNQTETQAVIYNPLEQLWFMYYHQVGVAGTVAGEVSILATSVNGVDNWTRVGVIFDYPATDINGYPPNPGLGYFRPFRIGAKWYAHSLMGGGDYGRFALWHSNDGRAWNMDPRPLGYEADQVSNLLHVEWNAGTVFFWNGELWWIGLIGNASSGGAARRTYYAAARISDDFRHLLHPPIRLFPTPATAAWETNPEDNRSGGSLIVDTDGALVLAFSGSATGFGIATGV